MWLFGKYKDLFLLFIPVWLIWVTLFLLPESLLANEVPLWVWVVFILGIDVSHVWSTIFRTYLDPQEFKNHKTVLILAPLIAMVILFGVARESPSIFWVILAYLAVFHFMKQQYGFFAIYTAKARPKQAHRFFKDKWVLYFSMIYPVIFWHFHSRNFVWFIEGDFFDLPLAFPPALRIFFEVIYWGSILGWLVEEFLLVKKGINTLSYGRTLWMLTTLLNWYLGIVWFNSDLAFTLTNVVAHGIPYLALVIFYQLQKKTIKPKTSFRMYWIVGSILILSFLLAFGEEYLWDMLLNRDKGDFFSTIWQYPAAVLSHPQGQALALTLLSLPQVTHYILDGFIWKMNDSNPHLKTFFSKQPHE